MNKYLQMLSRRKVENLYSFLNNQSYKLELIKSLENELCDYAVIVIWKSFMLFIYEKFHQIALQKPDLIKEEWNNKFGKKLKNFNKNNLYWPNTEDDDKILDFFGFIYPIDGNSIKLAKSASQKRNTASHVSQSKFTLQDVDAYLNEIVKLLPEFQEIHQKYGLDKVDTLSFTDEIIQARYSPMDISYLIDTLIDRFEAVSSFKEADKLKSAILNIKDLLTEKKVLKMLEAIQKNSTSDIYHQILQAGSTSSFLKEIYKMYPHPAEAWSKATGFIQKRLRDANSLESYEWLFEELGLSTTSEDKS